MLLRRLLPCALGVLASVWSGLAAAPAVGDCTRNPNHTRWFVQAGAPADGTGTKERPFAALADVERCAPEGATITVLAGAEGAPPLDGGIRLKNRQKLIGAEPPRGGRPSARVTNSRASGDAVTLAHANEVANLHIDSPAGAAILGDNIAGARLSDLLVTRQMPSAPVRLDQALCRIVRTGDAVDIGRSTLRGCTSRQLAAVKAAVMLLADSGAGAPAVKYSIERITVRDNPSHEKPETLWPAALSVNAGGNVAVTVDLRDSSVEFTARGIALRGYDRSTLTVNVTNTALDSLRSDGIAIGTGFVCSGLDKSFKTPGLDCGPLAPAPVSDARVVFNADGLRFTDRERKGQPNDAGTIEPAAMDQGGSTIEVHVQRSDLTGAAAAGVFTFYVWGRPRHDVMDFGCVNPAPGATSPDRPACRKLGYMSAGQNRIFGNTRHSESFSPYVEVALQGPGRMMAQGNYSGDITPADGRGDALGDCTVHQWSGDPKDTSPPITPVPESRCELYNISSQGNPLGIDGRFHLAVDPRPPK